MQSDRIRVRRIKPDDVAAVAALSGQLGYPATASEIERRLAGIGTDDSHVVYLAEQAAGNIVGWIHLYVCDLIVADRRVEIWGLVVDEKHRGRGIGRLLMARAEAWARSKGCDVVTLRSNVVREHAHSFYERQGYSQVKTQHVFSKRLPETP
jgi:GNAT superfamily N-acetyltransferase